LLAGTGKVEIVESAQLGPAHLAQLYGLEYAEGHIGGQRFMAPAHPAGSR
jgi:hypothetical protein